MIFSARKNLNICDLKGLSMLYPFDWVLIMKLMKRMLKLKCLVDWKKFFSLFNYLINICFIFNILKY